MRQLIGLEDAEGRLLIGFNTIEQRLALHFADDTTAVLDEDFDEVLETPNFYNALTFNELGVLTTEEASTIFSNEEEALNEARKAGRRSQWKRLNKEALEQGWNQESNND